MAGRQPRASRRSFNAPRRLHLNAIWFHSYDPLRGENAERQDRYLVGVGTASP